MAWVGYFAVMCYCIVVQSFLIITWLLLYNQLYQSMVRRTMHHNCNVIYRITSWTTVAQNLYSACIYRRNRRMCPCVNSETMKLSWRWLVPCNMHIATQTSNRRNIAEKAINWPLLYCLYSHSNRDTHLYQASTAADISIIYWRPSW